MQRLVGCSYLRGYSITTPLTSWKLWGLFNYTYPPMDLEVPTKSNPDLNMGNIADVCVWASIDEVMKSPKKCDYVNNA